MTLPILPDSVVYDASAFSLYPTRLASDAVAKVAATGMGTDGKGIPLKVGMHFNGVTFGVVTKSVAEGTKIVQGFSLLESAMAEMPILAEELSKVTQHYSVVWAPTAFEAIKCSICGMQADTCGHYIGAMYDGKMAEAIYFDAQLRETLLTYYPATMGTGVVANADNGLTDLNSRKFVAYRGKYEALAKENAEMKAKQFVAPYLKRLACNQDQAVALYLENPQHFEAMIKLVPERETTAIEKALSETTPTPEQQDQVALSRTDPAFSAKVKAEAKRRGVDVLEVWREWRNKEAGN